MTSADLDAVDAIACVVHVEFPESKAVFAERLELFPQGCFIAAREDGGILGYAISHPGMCNSPPALDTLLGSLPSDTNCLYLHDVALLPEARGQGLARELVRKLRGLTAAEGLSQMALVAVNGSRPMWEAQGFQAITDPQPALADKLASYGADAAYMIACLSPLKLHQRSADPFPERCQLTDLT